MFKKNPSLHKSRYKLLNRSNNKSVKKIRRSLKKVYSYDNHSFLPIEKKEELKQPQQPTPKKEDLQQVNHKTEAK